MEALVDQTAAGTGDPLKVLVISDNYPGHYNFADGVLAAIARLRPVSPTVVTVRGRFAYRMQAVRFLVGMGAVGQKLALLLGYGISRAQLPSTDLVLSGGGNTLAANVAAARLLGVPNIFCGSLRGGFGPDSFSLVVTSYEDQYDAPNHLATVKPSTFSPDTFHRLPRSRAFGPTDPPKRAGLLVGGKSGKIDWRDDEWSRLMNFMQGVHAAWGTRWLISTSRRTRDHVADRFVAFSRDSSIVDLLVDFRTAGPGTLKPIFERSDVMVCTTDSSPMVSEAIAVHLPVVVVSPKKVVFKREESDYRAMLHDRDWCRDIPVAALDVETFGDALAEIRVPEVNHLELLARGIAARLPVLFGR